MRQILIGKEGNQPFPINDPNVSRRHAVLNIDEQTGALSLIDNNSTNGTFIHNGQTFIRIPSNQQVGVSPDTMVQLGNNTRFHISKLLPKKAKPKRCDISHLRKVSTQYHNRKLELESQSASINGMRSAVFIASAICIPAGGIIGNALLGDIPNKEVISWGIGVLMAVIFFFILKTIIEKRTKKVSMGRAANERFYALKYVCPECHHDFRNKYYENILAEGRCPYCKAEFYEESKLS